jgi:hypothetical protein
VISGVLVLCRAGGILGGGNYSELVVLLAGLHDSQLSGGSCPERGFAGGRRGEGEGRGGSVVMFLWARQMDRLPGLKVPGRVLPVEVDILVFIFCHSRPSACYHVLGGWVTTTRFPPANSTNVIRAGT